MYMPKARGYRYIVAARDDLSRASEGRALRKANAKTLAKFFWEEILCRYGAVGQVVTDNGPEVRGAFENLTNRYRIPQIKISPYNSKANGVVERGHFIIREAIIKTCEGQVNKWPDKVRPAFFADKVTTSRVTGFTPFYLLHGMDPVLPFDLMESTFLVTGFTSQIPTDQLIALRIRQLEKREQDIHDAAQQLAEARFKSKEQFERRYAKRLRRKSYEGGEMVLVRNSEVEKELDRKSKPRYLGPYTIIRRTKGGSYVLREPDGTVMRRGVAPFRLLPYITRNSDHMRTLQDEDDDMSDQESDISDDE